MELLSYVPAMLLAVAIISLYIDSASKFFTVREHVDYKEAVGKALEETKEVMIRELDQIHARIVILESTRPTTGELEARFDRNGLHLKK